MIPPTALAYGAVLLDEKVTAAAIAGLVADPGRRTARGPQPRARYRGAARPSLHSDPRLLSRDRHALPSRRLRGARGRHRRAGARGRRHPHAGDRDEPDSCRHALAAADEHEEVYVSVGRHPHETKGLERRRDRRDRGAGEPPEGAGDRRGGPRLQARVLARRRTSSSRSSFRSSWPCGCTCRS